MDEEECLIKKIKDIKLLYKKYVYDLRILRLNSLLKSNENINVLDNFLFISNIKFNIDEKNHEWTISYIYENNELDNNLVDYLENKDDNLENKDNKDDNLENKDDKDDNLENKDNNLDNKYENKDNKDNNLENKDDNKDDNLENKDNNLENKDENKDENLENKDDKIKIKLLYYDNKFKIIGNNSRFKIYLNSKNMIRIIFKDLDDEYNLEKQLDLIKKLLNNTNIPEYLALQILSSISYNDWNGDDIFNYLYI
jgi:hypothetical protein